MNKAISSMIIAAFILLVAVSGTTQAKAQTAPIPLSETNLAPGVYVVAKDGYWPIQAWITAHPGKSIPASIIAIPEQQQVNLKSTTKNIHIHEDHHPFRFKFHDHPHEHDNDGDHNHGNGGGGEGGGGGGGNVHLDKGGGGGDSGSS